MNVATMKVVGIVLWTVVLATSGVVAAETTNPGSTTATADYVINGTTVVVEETARIVGFGGRASATITNDSVSVQANTGHANVSLSNIGSEDKSQSGQVEAAGINADSSPHANSGLCAAGFFGSESPIKPEVDGERGTFSVGFSNTDPGADGYDTPHRGMTVEEIVDACTTDDYGGYLD